MADSKSSLTPDLDPFKPSKQKEVSKCKVHSHIVICLIKLFQLQRLHFTASLKRECYFLQDFIFLWKFT